MMYSLRPIQVEDNAAIARIIRQVSLECGLAADEGFAVADPILDNLYQVYHQPKAQYWVVVDEHNQAVGGGGYSPLQGDATCLEIQKMYFLPCVRGYGLAAEILQRAFDFATQQGFTQCYLETTASLAQAVRLYEKMGFEHLQQPLGATGHSHACEIWMAKAV